MLNCINGCTRRPKAPSPSGKTFDHMNSRQVAEIGHRAHLPDPGAVQGMSVIDNIMTGRNLKIKSNLLLQALRIGPAEREEIRHREYVEHIIDLPLKSRPSGPPWASCPTACRSAWTWPRPGHGAAGAAAR